MTETVQYTEHALVTGIRETDRPRYGDTVSGYGRKLCTSYLIRYAGRWHRVYTMIYGNAGSPYIISKGVILHLDTDTEWDINSIHNNW